MQGDALGANRRQAQSETILRRLSVLQRIGKPLDHASNVEDHHCAQTSRVQMPRKVSHGWSTAQQGGYRPGGPVRQIYRKKPPVDQSLTIMQAAGLHYTVKTLCQNPRCLNKTETKAINLASNTKLTNLTLEQISKNFPCKKCGSSESLLLCYTRD